MNNDKHLKPPYQSDGPHTGLWINGHHHTYWTIHNNDTGVAIIIMPDEDKSKAVIAERKATTRFIVEACNAALESAVEGDGVDVEDLASKIQFSCVFYNEGEGGKVCCDSGELVELLKKELSGKPSPTPALTAENERLKGEKVDCLKKAYDQEVAIISLKAQVEHYKLQSDQLCDRVEVLAAENAALKGEVRRLTQCETNMTFLLDCIERAQFNLPDYTLGTWQERAKGLAPAIATLRSRLSALVTAVQKVNESKIAELVDNGKYAPDGEPLMDETGDYIIDANDWDALSSALAKAKGGME